jgi:hypothetical protein
VGQGRPGQKEISEDIGAEGARQLFRADILQVVLKMLLAGVVDENVEPAETAQGVRDDAAAEAFIADIAGHEARRAASFSTRRLVSCASPCSLK